MLRTDTPDNNADGFLSESVLATRYDGQSEHAHEVAGMLRALMPANRRVLDVGCGTGSVTRIANRGKGNTVLAIEPDAVRAAIAQERGIETACGLLDEDFLAKQGPFDVILSSDVLEHLPDPSSMLRLFAKGLKPDGLVLLSVPNVAHWSVRFDLLFGNFDYADVGIRDATHLRWFTAKTIRSLVCSSGFEVQHIAQTAGVDLPEYARRPWRWIHPRLRAPLIRSMNRLFPRMFGCQHVLVCRLAIR